MKPKLRIEDNGRRDKGAGEGKTKLVGRVNVKIIDIQLDIKRK